MSHSAAEANAITTQPLLSPMNIAEPNPLMENMANIPMSPAAAAEVITTQPMMSGPIDEEQEEKKQQRKDNIAETIEEVADDCRWCCFTSPNCVHSCDCSGCDNCCDDCCDDSGDCCTGCCEATDTANIDGDDVAGCIECCGACFECCSSD